MPHYFVSYSSREPHVENLLDALNLVLRKHFEQRRTPQALQSASSQYEQIIKGIEEASFCVVILDGLRPNVLFEYGIMVGKGKPVLLFKEQEAEVDIPSYYFSEEAAGGTRTRPFDPNNPTTWPSIAAVPPRTRLSVDSHFSDIKDQFQVTWYKFNPVETRRIVLEAYRNMRNMIPGFIEIELTAL